MTEAPINIEQVPDLLFNIMCAVRGVDPKQVQGLAKFMDVDSVDETTYYPNQLTSLAIAQLRGYSRANYPNHDWDPFEFIANVIGMGFKGYKGFKSEQYKDITRQTHNLENLQSMPEEVKQSITSRIFGGGKE
jgi:hypothetical protein